MGWRDGDGVGRKPLRWSGAYEGCCGIQAELTGETAATLPPYCYEQNSPSRGVDEWSVGWEMKELAFVGSFGGGPVVERL